jgi:CheY-like chemotaxis protein
MARSGDPVVKLLVGLILEDEQRHHSLLRSMVRRLQEEVEFVASASALPDLVLLDITMPRLIRA